MDCTSMDNETFYSDLFENVNRKNWDEVKNIIKTRASFSDVSKRDKNGLFKTILHSACNEDDPKTAKQAVEMIFEELRLLPRGYDEFKDFVNQKESNDRTALDIALEKGRDDIVQILLENNADVSIKFDSKINRRYHKVLSKCLDDGLHLENDQYDTSNEYLWNIWCKFSTFTGISTTDGNYRETKTLAKVLNVKGFKDFEFFLNPSVQIFVQAKCEKYKWFMWASFLVHILWYFSTTIYFYGTLQSSPTTGNTTQNISNNGTNTTNIEGISSTSWFQFIVFPYMFAVMGIKEVGKIVLTTTTCKTVYIRQCENWGKFVLLFIVFFAGTFGLYFWAKYVGIVLSVLLILKLFTKTDYFGLRLQVLLKSFILLIGYIISFSPVLFVFMAVFSTMLLPNNMNPFLRAAVGFANLFSKLAGELNFNDVFSDEKMKDEKNLPFLMIMAIIYFVFVLLALLLQNILIGQVVDNMKNIKRKATAAHVITRLQAVYTWESLLLGKVSLKFLHLIGMKDKIVKQLSVGPHGKEINRKPEGLGEEFRYKVEFLNTPDYIRETMYKSKSLFPNGVNPEDHEDW